jgi:3'(2'), 5'-bisphosphate nucleotidase/inositol polyphosphate 1-phosphatase
MSTLDLDPVVRAVSAASQVARRAAAERASLADLLKDDKSPVTVADLAVQVAVTAALRAAGVPFADRIVGEEGADSLDAGGSVMIEQLLRLSGESLAAAGLGHAAPTTEASLRELLDAGGLDPVAEGRDVFWCLDPIDGTKGFLRGQQFAIALGLVEGSDPKIGLLGCPHLPLGESDDYGAADPVGSVYLGVIGEGAWSGPATASGRDDLQAMSVSPEPPGGRVRVCLSYEKAHSDTDRTSAALEATGVQTTPIRIDSQCKYAMVASGRADLYLRLAREGYREKSWDHAGGCAVVRAAGGIVESATGLPLKIDGRWVDAPGGIVVRTNAVTVPAM